MWTLGVGFSLFKSSSVDVMFHQYKLAHRQSELRDTRLDVALAGDDDELGRGLDLVLAIEEWDQVELEFSASVFEAGAAFGEPDGDHVYGGFAAFRFAF